MLDQLDVSRTSLSQKYVILTRDHVTAYCTAITAAPTAAVNVHIVNLNKRLLSGPESVDTTLPLLVGLSAELSFALSMVFTPIPRSNLVKFFIVLLKYILLQFDEE